MATLTGGTTQGLVHDPFAEDNLIGQLQIPTIFTALDTAGVSWKVYYTVTDAGCLIPSANPTCAGMPSTTFTYFNASYQHLYTPATKGVCKAPAIPSKAVGDPTNAYCIDPTHVAPLSQYYTDAANGTLPSFAFIEAGYGFNDEHPASTQSILHGQVQVASLVNALMNSPSWKDSVFFLSYDEPGGPYDHVPPVPGHTNDNTNAALGITTDIASIAVSPDSYFPCPAKVPTVHCDLAPGEPGTAPDAAASLGFSAQLGFRVPNLVISPFSRRHYVSHTPMDHTAVIKFVESRFIGQASHLTNRDAVQPDLLEFFDFTNIPWATPATKTSAPPPAPTTPTPATCTAGKM
jgi:phospholipase C